MPSIVKRRDEIHILVVDDEPDALRYHAAILSDEGFTVSTAADGDEALEAVGRTVPDLISLDLVMPGKSGIRFLHALRRNRDWATIPVIIVTGHAHDDAGRGDLEAIRSGRMITGPQVCLDKPVRPHAYVAAVRERLGLASRGQALAAAPRSAIRNEIDELLDTADATMLRRVRRVLGGERATVDGERGDEWGDKRVLVVDDEPDVARIIAAILEDGGHEVEVLSDPRRVVERAGEFRPDLITLDLDMPGRGGLEVYRDLKSHADLRAVPVIVITGVEEDMRPALRGQDDVPDVDGYLEKPVRPDRLLALVSGLLAAET